jgi:hypothetical protein
MKLHVESIAKVWVLIIYVLCGPEILYLQTEWQGFLEMII